MPNSNLKLDDVRAIIDHFDQYDFTYFKFENADFTLAVGKEPDALRDAEEQPAEETGQTED